MAQDKIQLRGHHISTFAVHYWEDDFYKFPYEEPITKEDKFSRKKFYELQISENRLGRLSNQPKDTFTEIYGKRMENSVKTLYAILQIRPDLEIEIVRGSDSICNVGCPRFQPSCTESSSDDEDALTLEAYGLEVGRIYTAEDIIQKVRDFTMRTGRISPRSIPLGEMRKLFKKDI